jgi:hypothetical protein
MEKEPAKRLFLFSKAATPSKAMSAFCLVPVERDGAKPPKIAVFASAQDVERPSLN